MYVRLAGVLLIPLVAVLDASGARSAAEQSWPPFVLVVGLLLVGLVAGADGLFAAAADRLARLGGPPVALLAACLALVALVTALLNLDTAVVFLTPVLIETARRRELDPTAFLYGSVFMANASSLFLPGSNLTNLLVLSGSHISGAQFFARMLAVATVASVVTAAGLMLIHRRSLLGEGRGGGTTRTVAPRAEGAAALAQPRRFELGVGLWGALAAATLILVLRNAALPVLAIGVLSVLLRARQRRMDVRGSLQALGLAVLVSLFCLSVALGTLARVSAFPAEVLHSAGAPLSALVAALASVLVNNLPAAVLLSSSHQLPVRALLIGLNVGPNLAVTGSLAVLLWWRSALATGLAPSAREYSRQGLLLAPFAILAALAVAGGG